MTLFLECYRLQNFLRYLFFCSRTLLVNRQRYYYSINFEVTFGEKHWDIFIDNTINCARYDKLLMVVINLLRSYVITGHTISSH